MELAVQLGLKGATLRAEWLPRLQNEEADALTNFDFRHFDLNNRIEVKLEQLEFGVMNGLFQVGEDYLAKLELEKQRKKVQPAIANKRKKGLAGNRLADTDRW